MEFTAHDLITQVIDYQAFWSQNREEPGNIRRQRIEALQKAFGLYPEDPQESDPFSFFLLGKFMNERELEKNAEMQGRVHRLLRELAPDLAESPRIIGHPARERIGLAWMFNNLIHYRIKAAELTRPWNGFLEGFNAGLWYAKMLEVDANQIFLENLKPIDESLWLLADPDQRKIPLKVLVNEFNYPDVDLEKIDWDWEMENF